MDNQLGLRQVAAILQVETSTIHFWEKEFSEYLEQPSYKGQRKRFSPNNLETLALIKELLHTEGYTIKGAKRRLEMDNTLTSAIGIDRNFKTTIFTMFYSIMEQLQYSRAEMNNLNELLNSLHPEKEYIEDKVSEPQKGIFNFIKDKIHSKKNNDSTDEKAIEL